LKEADRHQVTPHLEILPSCDWCEQDLESDTTVIVEAVLAPRSWLIGQTLQEAHFREKFGMGVLAIWQAGQRRRTGLTDLPLQFGDALLLQGPRDCLRVLRDELDLIVLTNGKEKATRAGFLFIMIMLLLPVFWPLR
jgi:di/tricarboxylate transporter